MFTTENAEISDDSWKRRTRLYCMYYKRAFFIKAQKYRRFSNDIVQYVSVVFHGAFRWFFYNQKSFVRRQLRRYHLRHKIRLIKTRPNNPLRFLQRKNSIRRYLTNDLTCAVRKTKFKTRKRFHNKQYTSKIKRNNRLNQIALFLTQGLTTAALQCTVRPQFFFFLTKSQPFNKKQPTGTINQIKQSEKTIPATTQSKTLSKQTQQPITPYTKIFEY